jgi:small subunit ribosomal protein S17
VGKRIGKARTKVGFVTSNKMNKTVVIDVIQIISHSRYGKPVKRISRFKAHDEKNDCRIGDKVFIIETRPLSRTKRWRVSKILERGSLLEAELPKELLGDGGNEG